MKNKYLAIIIIIIIAIIALVGAFTLGIFVIIKLVIVVIGKSRIYLE